MKQCGNRTDRGVSFFLLLSDLISKFQTHFDFNRLNMIISTLLEKKNSQPALVNSNPY